MPASLDTRPPGINNTFRPGNPAVATIEFPASSLDSRTFTATLGGITLATTNGSLVVVGDIMTVTASATLTTTLGIGSHDLLVTETTGGGSTRVLIGRWTGSNRPNATGVVTVQIVDGEGATVNVTGGPQAFSPNLILPTATVNAGAGTVSNGKILRAHSIRMPWNYTSDVDPVDVAMGTAIQMDGTVTVTDTGGLGPVVQTGFFGPRGIVNIESNWRWNVNMTQFGFAPVGYGDFLTIGNQAGVSKDLAPSWAYLAARSAVADGASCELVGTDVNQGGAGFVDSPVLATLDSGTLDGITNNFELTHFYGIAGLAGNTSIRRRVVFDAGASFLGIHPTVPNPVGQAHWSGFGNFDATSSSTVQLDEEIGFRVKPFTLGDIKIGVYSAHTIKALTDPLTNTTTSPVVGLTVGVDAAGASVIHTVDDSAGFRTGADFKAFQIAPTVRYSSDGGVLGAFQGLTSAPLLTNEPTEAHTIPQVQMGAQRATMRADGAAVTFGTYIGTDDNPQGDIANAGTLTITNVIGFSSAHGIGASGTTTTRTGYRVVDANGSGSVGTQIGIDVAALAKGSTNVGIRNASTEVATPSVQTLTAVGNTITPNAKVKRLDNTSGGSLTLTSNPSISDGQNGQILILFNSSANDVVLTDGNGIQLGAATRTIGQRDTLMLLYSTDIGDWIELGFVNN